LQHQLRGVTHQILARVNGVEQRGHDRTGSGPSVTVLPRACWLFTPGITPMSRQVVEPADYSAGHVTSTGWSSPSPPPDARRFP
jgi:hypothetical protein